MSVSKQAKKLIKQLGLSERIEKHQDFDIGKDFCGMVFVNRNRKTDEKKKNVFLENFTRDHVLRSRFQDFDIYVIGFPFAENIETRDIDVWDKNRYLGLEFEEGKDLSIDHIWDKYINSPRYQVSTCSGLLCLLGDRREITGENCFTPKEQRSVKDKPTLEDIERRLFFGLRISIEE